MPCLVRPLAHCGPYAYRLSYFYFKLNLDLRRPFLDPSVELGNRGRDEGDELGRRLALPTLPTVDLQ